MPRARRSASSPSPYSAVMILRAQVGLTVLIMSCVKSGDDIEAYWRDAGTLDAYSEANVDLTSGSVPNCTGS